MIIKYKSWKLPFVLEQNMSHITKKGTYGILDQHVYFSIFWMFIILRLICENLSVLATKLSFLLGRKHDEYAAAPLADSGRPATFNFIILYLNIICIAKWLIDANFEEMLHY